MLRRLLEGFQTPSKVENDEVQLLVDGKYTSWSELKKRSFIRLDYNYNGIIVRSESGQYQAVPLLILPKKNNIQSDYKGEVAPEKPEMELIAQDNNRYGHAWIRLKHPDGRVYSFGLYREQQGVSLFQELAKGKGRLTSPDPGEFDRNSSIKKGESKEITEEDFQKMLVVFQDNKYRENLKYEAFDKNCAKWAVTSFEGKVHAKNEYGGKKEQIGKSYKIPLSELETPKFKKAGRLLKIAQPLLGRGKVLEDKKTEKKYKFTNDTYNYKDKKKKRMYSPIALNQWMRKGAYLGNEMKMQKK